jgi:hypothetical protein
VTSKRRDYGIGATTPVKIKQNRMSSFRTIQIAPNDKMMLGAARLYRLSNICERFANCRAAFQKALYLMRHFEQRVSNIWLRRWVAAS